MALMQTSFYSDVLGLSTQMTVILPETAVSQIGQANQAHGGPHKTLWLLHGLSDDHSIWLRRTSIERYAAHYGIAVVMPSAGRSFYCDMEHGYNYWSFVSQELPAKARAFFPLSDRREDNFAAGLSMGGYGALKLGLTQPECFAAVASLSGAADIRHILKDPNLANDSQLIFGDYATVHPEDDLFTLATGMAGTVPPASRPRIFQCCGTEDFLYADNVRFHGHCEKLGIAVDYREGPGDHEWGYWDTMIQRALAWMLPERA